MRVLAAYEPPPLPAQLVVPGGGQHMPPRVRAFLDYAAHLRDYSDVSPVPTDAFFYGLRPGEETEIEIEEGKLLFVKLIATTAPASAAPASKSRPWWWLPGRAR